MRFLLFAAAVLACVPSMGMAATQAETCGKLEDFALAVIRAKQQGVPEVSLRSGQDIPADSPMSKLFGIAYSSDQVTEDLMMAEARLQCDLAFLFAPDDGSRVNLDEQVDASLPTLQWIEACTKLHWMDFNMKIKGEGTLINIWDKHVSEMAICQQRCGKSAISSTR